MGLVSYGTWKIELYAGECGINGTADGALKEARFTFPGHMVRDPVTELIYLAGKCLRKIHQWSKRINALPNTCLKDGLVHTGVLIDPTGGLVVLQKTQVLKYDLSSNNATLEVVAGNETNGAACENCTFIDALFDWLSDAKYILPTILLLVDTENNQLRLMNMTSEIVTALMSVGQGSVNDNYKRAKLLNTHCLTADETYIYVGELGPITKISYAG